MLALLQLAMEPVSAFSQSDAATLGDEVVEATLHRYQIPGTPAVPLKKITSLKL
jgi:hypothetical protein